MLVTTVGVLALGTLYMVAAKPYERGLAPAGDAHRLAAAATRTSRDGRPLQAPRQPPRWRKTATATRTRPPDQAAQDRPGPPASQDHLLLVQQERCCHAVD